MTPPPDAIERLRELRDDLLGGYLEYVHPDVAKAIVELHDALPALLDENERLREVVEAARRTDDAKDSASLHEALVAQHDALARLDAGKGGG